MIFPGPCSSKTGVAVGVSAGGTVVAVAVGVKGGTVEEGKAAGGRDVGTAGAATDPFPTGVGVSGRVTAEQAPSRRTITQNRTVFLSMAALYNNVITGRKWEDGNKKSGRPFGRPDPGSI